MLPPHELEKYVQYIRNTGLVPLPVAAFDDDWEPVGPMVRADLVASGRVTESGDGLRVYQPEPAPPADPTQLPLGQVIFAGLSSLGYEASEEQVQAVIEAANELLIEHPGPAGMIEVRLDLGAQDQPVQEGFARARLPTLPMPGEGLVVGEAKYRVHARMHLVDEAGNYEAGLLVERLGPPPSIVPAAAGAVDQLERSGKLIMPR